VAIPAGIRVDKGNLRDRLLVRGFTEEFLAACGESRSTCII